MGHGVAAELEEQTPVDLTAFGQDAEELVVVEQQHRLLVVVDGQAVHHRLTGPDAARHPGICGCHQLVELQGGHEVDRVLTSLHLPVLGHAGHAEEDAHEDGGRGLVDVPPGRRRDEDTRGGDHHHDGQHRAAQQR